MNAPLSPSVSVSHQQSFIDVLLEAFYNDPAARWMYPGDFDYLNNFPEFVRIFGGKAFGCGTADGSSELGAVALWLPPGVQPDEEPLMSLLRSTVAQTNQEAMFSVFKQMGSFHPAELHWYLPLIGVDPVEQGKGLGSALLAHALRRCDRQGLPAYLEATNLRNVALYRRHGFIELGRIQAGDSPEIIPMKRTPRRPAPDSTTRA